jgi:hypothetical protein
MMTRSRSCLVRIFGILLLAHAFLPSAIHCQSTAYRYLDSGRKLVVSVRAQVPGLGTEGSDTTWSRGSGIILGIRSDSLFVATTHHGIESVIDAARAELDIYLQSGSPTLLPATVRNFDRVHDLAILVAALPSEILADTLGIPFSRAGDPQLLRRGDLLLPVGCPVPSSCQVPVTPSLFSSLNGPDLIFEANNITRGFSGGALFTQTGELVGMITRDRAPTLVALRLDSLVQITRSWGVPVNLTRPPMDPFAVSYSVAAVAAVLARRSSGVSYAAWVERAQDLRGPIQHLGAIRVEGGESYQSVSLHTGIGARGRLGRTEAHVHPTSSVSAFLDAGLSFNEVKDVEVQSSVGWSAGISFRLEFMAERRTHGGLIVEARKMGPSFSASSADAVTVGLIFGWSP